MVSTITSNNTISLKTKLSNKSNSWLSATGVFVETRYTNLCRVCLSKKEKADWQCSDCKLKFHQRCIPKNNDPNVLTAMTDVDDNTENNICGWCLKDSYSGGIESIVTHIKNKHLVKWKSLSYLRCDWVPRGWLTTRKPEIYTQYKKNNRILPPSGQRIIDSNTRILKILNVKKHNETLRLTPNNIKMFRASYKGQKNRAYWEIPPAPTDERFISYQHALDDFRAQYLVQSSKRKQLI